MKTIYDFSKAREEDIKSLVQKVRDVVAANPGGPNADEQRNYIQQGEEELSSRERTRTLTFVAIAAALLIFS